MVGSKVLVLLVREFVGYKFYDESNHSKSKKESRIGGRINDNRKQILMAQSRRWCKMSSSKGR